MKRVVKNIAMILIIVLLVNCFTGCVELITVPVMIISYTLIGGLVVGAVVGTIQAVALYNGMKNRGIRRANPYLFENSEFNGAVRSLPEEELDSLGRAFYSLPESGLNLFTDRLSSMSREETILLMEALNSFSDEELAYHVRVFSSMPETETASSLEYLNAMPRTVSLAGLIQNMEPDVSGERVYAARNLRH